MGRKWTSLGSAGLVGLALSGCGGTDDTTLAVEVKTAASEFPAAQSALRTARRFPVRAEEMLELVAPLAGARGQAIRAEIPELSDEPMVLSREGEAGWELRVRYPDAETRSALVDSGTVVRPGVAPGTDAIMLSAGDHIEELLYLRQSEVVRYDLDLPSGWSVVQAGAQLVDLQDATGNRAVRVSAARAWDAQGQRVKVALSALDDSIAVEVEGDPAWPVLVDPAWSVVTGELSIGRWRHCAQLLPNGAVAVFSGRNASVEEDRVEFYDPIAGTWAIRSWVEAELFRGECITSGFVPTVLSDGTWLLRGEFFDPVEGFRGPEWITPPPTGDWPPQNDDPLIALHDGRVLWLSASSASILDLSQDVTLPGAWTSVDPPPTPPDIVVQLQDGRVAVSGGGREVYLLDPVDGSWTSVALTEPSAGVIDFMTQLPDGRLLVAAFSASPAWLYDFELATWAETSVPTPDSYYGLSTLPDGRLATIDGSQVHITPAELAPQQEDVALEPSPQGGHDQGAVVTLASGDVMLVGGRNAVDEPSPLVEIVAASTGEWEDQLVPPEPPIYPCATAIPSTLFPMPGGGVLCPESAAVYDPNARAITQVPCLEGIGGRNLPFPLMSTDGTVLLWYEDQIFTFDQFTSTCQAGVPFLPDPPPGDFPLGVLAQGSLLTLNRSSSDVVVVDPATGATTTGPRLTLPSSGMPTFSRLGDGRILAAGGIPYPTPLEWDAEVFDPETMLWHEVGGLINARRLHAAVTLPSGEVLVLGGETGSNPHPTATAEIFDPTTESWHLASSMHYPRVDCRALLLPSGRVFIVGYPTDGGTVAELYQPTTDTWVEVPDPPNLTPGPPYSLVLLADGAVLVTGNGTPFLWREQSLPLSSRPQLATSLHTVNAAASLSLTGQRLMMGPSPLAHRGWSSSAFPIPIWMPLYGGMVMGNGTGWTDSGLTWQAPEPRMGGPGFLFTVTSGLLSNGTWLGVHAKALGASCRESIDCLSSYCVDGVCCNETCDGPCVACSLSVKGSGVDGECGPIPPVADPEVPCVDQGVTSCGHTGLCDGQGHCASYSAGTVCVAGSCGDTNPSLYQPSHLCDGAGACVPSVLQSCSPFLCTDTAPGARCSNYCTSAADCVDGAYCRGGTCYLPQDTGTACTAGTQCLSGNCVNGVCCDQPCTASCTACTAALKGSGDDGMCGVIAAGTDPLNDCDAEPVSSCGQDGECNGFGGCRVYPRDTPCGDVQCTDGSQGEHSRFSGFMCDGFGSCQEGDPVDCGQYRCQGDECGDSCTTSTDCIDTAFCNDSGECVQRALPAGPCTRGVECSSGHCVDGVCCNTACTGQCEACDVADAMGSCVPVVDEAPHGTRPPCAHAGTECGGVCNGVLTVQCAFPGGESVCGQPRCVDAVQYRSFCNGQGECGAEQLTGCVQYQCTGDACGTSCTTDADCTTLYRCEDGQCILRRNNGAACADASQCSSGSCTNGVCCDQPCGAPCTACTAELKGSGIDGVCGVVAAGTDPLDHCETEAVSACGQDGECNGFGGCRLYARDTPCGEVHCTDGAQGEHSRYAGLMCDGFGSCLEADPVDCGQYRCQGDACGDACTASEDCIDTAFCGGLGECVQRAFPADPCTADEECTTGHCVDGVCCNTACSGQCEACDVTDSIGVCVPVANEAPHGTRAPCSHAGSECGGVCNGVLTAECAFPGREAECGTPRCEDAVQYRAYCDGAGECGEDQLTDCVNYVCDGDSCGTSCETDADCTEQFRCDAELGECIPASASQCDGEHTLVGPDGEQDCSPYRCTTEADQCLTACDLAADCVAGYRCSVDHTCEPRETAPDSPDSGGCSCRMSGTRTPPRELSLLGGLLVLGLLGGRRRAGRGSGVNHAVATTGILLRRPAGRL